MSQERMNAGDSQRKVTSTDYQAPDIDATLNRAKGTLSKVRVVNGANEQYFDNLEGKNVGSVRKSLREVFNIPGDASALIGGKEVGDDFILEGGMNLEFIKEAGVKGWGPHKDGKPISEEELERRRSTNNPKKEPTGPFTGRCPACGSKNLWDDNTAYGCNDCHALLGT
jgi:hypothetical protein